MPSPPPPFHSLPTPTFMGILNITPDSFSDTAQHFSPPAAIAHAHSLIAQGAIILDLGAEASSFFRPGNPPVPAEEQLRRLLPVLQGLHPLPPNIRLSIDTRSSLVARETLAAGAHIINDISAGTHDPDMFPTLAQLIREGVDAGIILMHITPTYPATPAADDPDILATVRDYLQSRIAAALAVGIPPDRIALDPGIGFGKTMPDNWQLALRSHELLHPDQTHPIVIGASRKRFLETMPPEALIRPAGWHKLLSHLFTLAANTPNYHPRDPATAALVHHLSAPGSAGGSPPTRLIHRLHQVTLAHLALTI